MALKDCIKKMKGAVSDRDIASLEQFIADGLSDEQAVQKLYLESSYNVVQITQRAAEQGAVIANRPDMLAEISSLQAKRADKVRAERVKLEKEMRQLHIEYAAIDAMVGWVRKQAMFNNAVGKLRDDRAVEPLDIYDDQQLNTVLSSMLFGAETRELLLDGYLGLQGKTPLELVANFKALLVRQAEIGFRRREILVLDSVLIDKLDAVGGRKGETFFQVDQDVLGFRSGLLSAVRIMPQEKGPAKQMIAYLKKQPGVKKQELEWIDFEAWANAKGTVTREKMIAYVQENGVQVQETQYGGPTLRTPQLQFDINENATTDYRMRAISASSLMLQTTRPAITSRS